VENFGTPEQEAIFLVGQHAFDAAVKRGAEYYVRRLNMNEFRQAARGLRLRVGPERSRFVRSLPPDVQGALIHSLLDPFGWDRLVLDRAVEKVPSKEAGAKKKPRLRTVEQRRLRTSRLDPDEED